MKHTDKFFSVFEQELKTNPKLNHYHRIINSPKTYLFRRAYYQQRLEFVMRKIDKEGANILDVGCGYGTTSFMLGMHGHEVTGTTLEYYYDQIDDRRAFWNQYFDTGKVAFKYENIFFSNYADDSFDYIIVQDTIHHLEPIHDALQIFQRILKKNGKILVSEENGSNIICNMKHFRERGFKRVIEIYDENLQSKILFGNENTRSLRGWINLFEGAGLKVDFESIEHIRLLPPWSFRGKNMMEVIEREKSCLNKLGRLRNYFSFGFNFVAHK